jgi:hypothetical protein
VSEPEDDEDDCPLLYDEELDLWFMPPGFDYRWYDFYLEDDEDDEVEAHCIPVGDTGTHIASEDCKCQPDEDVNGVWLHWAFDGRDYYEMKKRRPN